MQHICNLRSNLAKFYKHLKREDALNVLYTRKLEETGIDHAALQQ